jgi:G3E family GTPase
VTRSMPTCSKRCRAPGTSEMNTIPVILFTGFLGSGKTTLIQALLARSDLADTAVIINEFGEVGIDHYLVRQVTENVVLLPSGCVCCTVRDDLGAAMRDLLKQRDSGTIPKFSRLVVETTGLADPVPIIHTLMTDPGLDRAFHLQTIVTTIDAVNGDRHLSGHPESVKQVAVADRLIITKTDLAPPATVRKLEERLWRANPSAKIEIARSISFRPEILISGGSYDLRFKSYQARVWLNEEAYHAARGDHECARSSHVEHDQIVATSFSLQEVISWTAFSIWLSMLLHARGSEILRVKGLLNLSGETGPVVIHGVQHILHPPIHLSKWPDSDHSSRIIIIARGVEPAMLKHSLAVFNRAAINLRGADILDWKPAPAGAGAQVGGRPFRRASGLSWMK